MTFLKEILASYFVVHAYRVPDFAEPFEIDGPVSEFMTQYGLWGDVDVVAEARIKTDQERQRENMQKHSGGGKVKTDRDRHTESLKDKGGGKLLSDRERAAQNAGGGGGKIITDRERAAQQAHPDKKKPATVHEHPTPRTPEYPEGTKVRLKPQVQKNLASTFKGTVLGNDAEERLKGAKEAFTKQVYDLIKEVAKKEKIEPRGIQVDVELDTGSSSTAGNPAGKITIRYKGQEAEIEPEGLYFKLDKDGDRDDAMSSNDWAAWLMHGDSPFGTDSFRDAYDEEQASLYFQEAGSLEGSEQEIKRKVRDLLHEHELEKEARRA